MSFDLNTLRDIVIVLVPMILSLTVHEFAHAWSAHLLGDDTASSQGRMTLNPLPHIDIFGTLLIPIFSVMSGGISLIGWAKPVPITPHRFTRKVTMRTGMIISALAGPGSNIVLAFLVGGAAMALFGDQIDGLLPQMRDPSRSAALLYLGGYSDAARQSPALMLLAPVFLLNIGLAVFNMLPIPPLDGSRVLPTNTQEKLARYTMIIFIGFLIVINVAHSILWPPIRFIGDGLLGFWSLFFG